MNPATESHVEVRQATALAASASRAGSRVLVLSAHAGQIDRRIVAEVNSLVTSGREVSLVSVPADVARSGMHAGVRVAMASGAQAQGLLRRVARRLPKPLLAPAKWIYRHFVAAPAIDFTGYFVQQAATLPAGERPFDVIHCHDLQTLPAAIELRRTLAPSAKLVYDSHELFPHQYPPGRVRDYWADVERRCIGEVDLVITINQSVAAQMQQTYGGALPAVIYNSCEGDVRPCDRERFLRHFGIAPGHRAWDAFTVIYQGNFSRERNLRQLVEAFSQLGNEVVLLMLGGGEELPRLQKLAGSNVFFGPWVPQDELLGFVAAADMGVIPYLGDDLLNNRLCTPNKLFEYMQAQVPICASDLVELRRIVGEQKIGGVYPMQTAAEIAAAVRDCVKRCQSGEFRRESLAAAQQAFCWAGQEKVLLELYASLGC